MRKIPTLFQRNYDGDRLVRDELTPGCEWVLAGEGKATRKWDGSACLMRDGKLYRRYDAKKGRALPDGFIAAQEDADAVTGHFPGWLPVSIDNPGDRWHCEALEATAEFVHDAYTAALADGTYELIGPKIQGNPEQCSKHILIPHGRLVLSDAPRDFAGLEAYLERRDIEGIVWWRDLTDPACDKVKLKKKDFGFSR